MIKISGLEHLIASEHPEVLGGLLVVSEGRPRRHYDYLKYSKTTSQVLDACRTRLRRARGLVRPGAARLLIGLECSRVRNISWMYLTSFVTTRIGVELATVQRKLLDRAVVRLQLYSVRTFHVNLSPWIYNGGQVSPRNTSTPKAIQTTTQYIWYYINRGPNLSKSLCSLHHRVLEQSIPTYKPYC